MKILSPAVSVSFSKQARRIVAAGILYHNLLSITACLQKHKARSGFGCVKNCPSFLYALVDIGGQVQTSSTLKSMAEISIYGVTYAMPLRGYAIQ
jgi:hypothetical protein